jgi:hypothetical protein
MVRDLAAEDEPVSASVVDIQRRSDHDAKDREFDQN